FDAAADQVDARSCVPVGTAAVAELRRRIYRLLVGQPARRHGDDLGEQHLPIRADAQVTALEKDDGFRLGREIAHPPRRGFRDEGVGPAADEEEPTPEMWE